MTSYAGAASCNKTYPQQRRGVYCSASRMALISQKVVRRRVPLSGAGAHRRPCFLQLPRQCQGMLSPHSSLQHTTMCNRCLPRDLPRFSDTWLAQRTLESFQVQSHRSLRKSRSRCSNSLSASLKRGSTDNIFVAGFADTWQNQLLHTEDACNIYRPAIALYRRMLRPDHCETEAVMLKLERCCSAAGHLEEAQKRMQKVMVAIIIMMIKIIPSQ